MKRIAIVAAVVAATLGTAGAASAIEFNVGPGGVYVGPQHHHRDHRRGWRAYNYARDCRVVVRHHINRWGERVTVRRRICD
jgi:hypothetical protein